jgi:hypothetical protein
VAIVQSHANRLTVWVEKSGTAIGRVVRRDGDRVRLYTRRATIGAAAASPAMLRIQDGTF